MTDRDKEITVGLLNVHLDLSNRMRSVDQTQHAILLAKPDDVLPRVHYPNVDSSLS